jgi:hypothetical protein
VPSLPYCFLGTGDCVECESSANCGGADHVCDRTTHACVPACQTNADCAASVKFPWCDPTRNLCVECLADEECPVDIPHCATDVKRCSPCAVNADCTGNTRFCDTQALKCVQCLVNADCANDAPCNAGVCVNPK